MSGSVSGLFFPGCAVAFSILMCVTYFSKKRIDLKENRIYSNMLILILADSIFATLIQIIAQNGVSTQEEIFVTICNKLDFISLIFYSTCIFLYTIII